MTDVKQQSSGTPVNPLIPVGAWILFELPDQSAVVGSARPNDSVACLPCRVGHPVVVRDERTEFIAKLAGRGEVNRIEGA